MTPLTEVQINYVLDTFFANERFAGWRGIGRKLIERGSCIVGNTERIWNGGVGNFISMTPAENTVDCMLHTFDREEFFLSKFYEEVTKSYMEYLNADIEEAERQVAILNHKKFEIFE